MENAQQNGQQVWLNRKSVPLGAKEIWFKSLPCYFLIFHTLSEPQISPLQNEDNNTNFVGLLQDLNKKYIFRVFSTILDTQKKASKKN